MMAVIERLGQLGYDHQGNLGITDRESFRRRSEKVPANGSGRNWMAHHLYVCPENSISLRNHLALRNFLRMNPEKVREYSALKKRLAATFPFDMASYVAGKTGFITSMLRESGFSESAIESIRRENL